MACVTCLVSTEEVQQDRPHPGLRQTAVRVPAVTVAFWITKGLTTGMGESSSDYLVHRLPPAVAVGLGGIALAAALALQFATRRYVPWIYWLAVAMVGVFGTMAADVLHVGLGVPYFVSTALFAVSLAAIFALWYLTEKTLSIHSIYTTRREVFYWAAVMATLCARHRCGRHDCRDVASGLLRFGRDVCGRGCGPRRGPSMVRSQRDSCLLAGLRRHSAARGLIRRLDGRIPRSRRPRPGRGPGQPGSGNPHRRIRRVSDGQLRRRRRRAQTACRPSMVA